MSEFKKAVDDVNRQLREIEDRKRVRKLIEKRTDKNLKSELSFHEKLRKDEEDLFVFRRKEKGIHALVVFIVGQIAVGHLYFNYPEFSLGISLLTSISLLVICFAVYDYT